MNRYITLDEQDKVTRVRLGTEILSGEFESDFGEVGQIMQQDGSFITPDPEPVEPQVSLNEIAEETLLETKYQTLLLEMML